ncbi:AraC family transcriptional regulator [Paenibacillus sepulcri]|uniref:AraC family transcriptional regulator n=3 Tax=Paenibacillus sepulcri TaxID=359917 RepID=A0ABS7BZI8_9BACL|nr:AraC family transcriptional regulator [Paenibacillus sepulcri]
MSYINMIQRSILFIEDNLFNPLSLKTAAGHVHISPWHFHRLFRMVAGEPAAVYIRKRRFSIAAMELLESNKRIIEIAVELGFASHEAFTRSFKQVTGITPEQYRIRGLSTFHYPMLSFTDNELFSTASFPTTPDVRIISLNSLQVSGLRLKGLNISASFSMEHNQKEIECLWRSIHPAVEFHQEQAGVIIPTGGTRFDYLAGLLTDLAHPHCLPGNWEVFSIPKRTYAVCSHWGSLADLPHLFKYMVGNWLSEAEFELVYGPELELYRFDPEGGRVIDIHIPVQKR